MSAIAELLVDKTTQVGREEFADLMEIGLTFVASGEVIEHHEHFIHFSDNGAGPCLACAAGLALIGKMGGVEQIKKNFRTGYVFNISKITELIGCSELLVNRVSRAHCHLGMSASEIIRGLRDGSL